MKNNINTWDDDILIVLSNKSNKELNNEIKWFKKNIDKNYEESYDYHQIFKKKFFNNKKEFFNYTMYLKKLMNISFSLKRELLLNEINFWNNYDFKENFESDIDILNIIKTIQKN